MHSQLSLFEDAPRFYHQALERLGRLDLAVCRSALEEHRRSFPRGLDPAPVREAADWLEERLPDPGGEAGGSCRLALALARDLREGRACGQFRELGEAVVGAAVSSLALRCVARMASEGLDPAGGLTEDLPWGVFHLLARRWAEAEGHLEKFLTGCPTSSAAYAALGDSRWNQAKREPAYIAYREACALDPSMGGWAVACKPLWEKRSRLQGQPEWAGGWWAVGAYLEGVFPPFPRPPGAELKRKWQRFLFLRERWLSGAEVAPQLFFSGLFLSENAPSVLAQGEIGLGEVRRVLSALHPEAWERHWEAIGG